MICLNFKESQPKYAYKRYAYKKKKVYHAHAPAHAPRVLPELLITRAQATSGHDIIFSYCQSFKFCTLDRLKRP